MAEKEKNLFLLDAYALIFRAYYAFIKNPRINSKGLNTSAMFGFTNSLVDILNNQDPSHIAVVFDYPDVTFRDEMYEEYKANRHDTPEDIKKSVPYIKKIIEAFNIPILEAKGYEADDVIATLAKKAEQKGYKTYMMTPDKDFGQLVTENVVMYKPARSGNKAEVWGIEEVCKRFDLERPEQVIDILALMGDSVDNIPGVPGVGEKTAIKFIKQYGSVEGLYEHLDELKGKMKEKVETNKEQAFLSKQLATILTDAPVEFNEKALEKEEPNKDALREVFAELEFRQLSERILGEGIKSAAGSEAQQMDLFNSGNGEDKKEEKVADSGFKNLETVKHDYRFTNKKKDIEALAKKLGKAKSFCFDTETTGINPMQAELVGLAFSLKKGEAFYVPVPEDQEEAKTVVAHFKAALENESVEKIGQNIKYDILVLRRYGVEVAGKIFDTMLAHYLIEPDMRRRSMDVLAETYLNYQPVSIETLIGKKGKAQKSMRSVDPETVSDYACEDADITLQLRDYFDPELDRANARKIFEEIETPLIRVLADMEVEGVFLNANSLKELSNQLVEDIKGVEKEIYGLAGVEFLISSPKQVGEVLFERLKVVDKPRKTKSGQYATSEEVLAKLSGGHPIIDKILDYRELMKLKNTYVDPLPTLINPNTGRLHTSYNQVVAATGRLSSDNPNLQNIPIRTERGQLIRKAFEPRNKEYILLASDYSQIELRLMAAMSKDEDMLNAFNKNIDIHATTASKVFNVDIDKVTRDQRSKAKTVNFGIIYGISAFGLAQRINISRTEAKEIIDNYFAKYPGVKTFMDEQIERARKNGYVETLMGRRRILRDINSSNPVVRGHAERNAINAPIQGSAADMIKIAMIDIHKALKKEKLQSKMILQVHDELVFDVHRSEINDITPLIEEKMKTAMELPVPIEVESGTGKNWLEAH